MPFFFLVLSAKQKNKNKNKNFMEISQKEYAINPVKDRFSYTHYNHV
jgi:hypothetical protein